MSKLYPKGVSNFYAIIPHPSLPRFLMLSESEGWSLPSVQWNEFKELNDVNPLQKALHQNLGINVTVLCCVYACNESDQLNAVYLLENSDLAPFSISRFGQRFEGNFKTILCSNISIVSDGAE